MSTRDIGLTALFAAVIVAFGFVPAIPLGFIPVPITLQTLGVMLAGLVIGPKRGAAACLVVIALVAVGLPVLSGGRGGLGVFVGPTAGFLYGWVPGAFLAGLIAEASDKPGRGVLTRFIGLLVGAVVGGIIAVYALGILWLTFVTGLPFAKAALGSAVFLIGDGVKAIVAALIALKVSDAVAIKRV